MIIHDNNDTTNDDNKCTNDTTIAKCRDSKVVWGWAGVRRSRVQSQPKSTIRVRRQTLQILWGSAFASQATAELEWKTRLETNKRKCNVMICHILII